MWIISSLYYAYSGAFNVIGIFTCLGIINCDFYKFVVHFASLNLQDNSMPTIILFIQKFQIMLPGAYEFNISQQTEDALTYIMAE